ncbi:MYCBP-associated protein family-domain-containing protein [Powellomyces hirtus]|nr:MYCBP-associated protein family-domain-containing protein [Powellomyces hirtus]
MARKHNVEIADHVTALERVAEKLASPPPLPTGDGKKFILVAKKFPPDYMGEDLQYTHPERVSVPVSVLSKKDRGPRRTRHGRIVEHTLLGDADDFEEMERQLYGDSDDSDYIENDGATFDAADEGVGNGHAAVAPQHRMSVYQRMAVEETKRKQAEEKRMWLSQLHVFQRYREVREEHALKNWQRHSVQWNRTEAILAKKSKRTTSDLLMARIGEYRERLEEHELVETALRLLDEEHVDFWKTGLRLGSDLLGLTMPLPRGGPRQIERVRAYEGRSRNKSAIGRRPPPNAKGEMYGDIISLFDPFHSHGDSGYMELTGHNTVLPSHMQRLATSYLSKLDSRISTASSNNQQQSPYTEDSESFVAPAADGTVEIVPEETATGPALTLATNRLSFQVVLKEVSVSVLTVYNCGSTACEFEWVKMERPNPLKVSAIYEPTQRFFFYHKRGVIQPSSAFDFPIIFKSGTPGIYTEQWVLNTIPVLSSAPQPVLTLQGIAIESDANSAKRKGLEAKLIRAQALTAAKAIVERILASIKPRTVSARSLRRLAGARDEQLFVKRNRELGLYYVPKIFAKFLALAADAHVATGSDSTAEWDRSVMSLSNLINTIEDADAKSACLRRLNSLIVAAGMEPRDTIESMLHVIANDSLAALAENIAEISDGLRRRFQLPIMRAAARFDDSGMQGSDEDGAEGHGAAVGAQQQPTTAQAAAPQQAAPSLPVLDAAAGRKSTPPVAAGAAGEEKVGKKAGAPSAKDAGKKGAAGVALAAAAPAGGKSKPSATPSATAAPAAASTAPIPATGKAAKYEPASEVDPQVTRGPLVLAKITMKPKKPDSSRGWNKERKLAEDAYRVAFRAEVAHAIEDCLSRMCELFMDAGSAF